MKRIINFLLLGAFASTTVSCNAESNMILEYKDVQFFKVTEDVEIARPSSGEIAPLKLKISGLAFHSSLAVNKIESKVDGRLLTVYVYLEPAKKGLSGSFQYELTIPESVTEVRFGKEGSVIWTRQKNK